MLESLYDDHESMNSLFSRVQQFLEQKNILLELKRSFHFSDLAVQSASLLLNKENVSFYDND
jgi:hypothetical protein